MIHSKQHRGCRFQDPGTHGKHQTKAKNPWCTSRGCRVQNSGPWDRWLPVVKNSQLFAQCGYSAGTARAQRTVRPLDDRSCSTNQYLLSKFSYPLEPYHTASHIPWGGGVQFPLPLTKTSVAAALQVQVEHHGIHATDVRAVLRGSAQTCTCGPKDTPCLNITALLLLYIQTVVPSRGINHARHINRCMPPNGAHTHQSRCKMGASIRSHCQQRCRGCGFAPPLMTVVCWASLCSRS